ncbi:MAG: glycosyltransferase family 4 protein [Anaerolineae bacterium]
MRILTVSVRDDVGGAARAAHRLHTSLVKAGVDAKMLVRWKSRPAPDVLTIEDVGGKIGQAQSQLGYLIDRRPLSFYPRRNRERYFSINWFPTNIAHQIRSLQPDIVHLHGVGQGFVPVGAIRQLACPVVWTLHDVWPFTGGCFLLYGCSRYEHSCGCCPHLGSNQDHDISHWNWRQKHALWRNVDLSIVTPSEWLGTCAKSSSLFHDRPLHIIPYGIDLDVYHPIDKQAARAALNLPQDVNLILFGAVFSTSDHNKGFHLLEPALQEIAAHDSSRRKEVVVFGHASEDSFANLGLPVHCVGYISDESKMALLYAAADVLVIPSLQENFPQVLQEAMACGTPCVGFRIGGIPDMIDHQVNGYTAKPYEVDDLAHGIAWILEDHERWRSLSMNASSKVQQQYEDSSVTGRYIALYETLLTARASKFS